MREFKFRIWSNDSNRFVNSFTGRLAIIGFEYLVGALDLSIGKKNFEDQFSLQQSTGLFDKNKKLIFEGDILKINHFNNEDNFRYAQVKYGEGIFDGGYYSYIGFYLEDKDGDILEPQEITSLTNNDSNYIFEIVGNIFENPELLKNE